MAAPARTDIDQTGVKVSEVRAYLRSNRPDLQVGLRGTLSADAISAYNEAHPHRPYTVEEDPSSRRSKAKAKPAPAEDAS